MRIGLEIASVLQKRYPDHFDVTKLVLLLGNDATIEQLKAGTPPEQIVASWEKSLAEFEQLREKYFLYK
jgi:uncharacterized protein YbbC (DUF1343 family)